MNNGVRAIAALLALAGWGVLVVATVAAFSFGAALWLTLSHASLRDAFGVLPWRDAVSALVFGGVWLVLRKLRSRLEARISAEEPERLDPKAMAERASSVRFYQWLLALVTVAIVSAALILHNIVGSSRERFNTILFGLIATQVVVTLAAFAFFSYGVDIPRLFHFGKRRSRREP